MNENIINFGNDNILREININDYILVNNKFLGKIIKIIWNSNGYIIKLENNTDYIDRTLVQYKLLDIEDLKGYMVVTLNNNIIKIDSTNICDFIKDIDNLIITNNLRKLNINYNLFIDNINMDQNYEETSNYPEISNSLYHVNKFNLYRFQEGQNENYIKYINLMIDKLFIDNKNIKWEEDFLMGAGKSIDVLGEENIRDVIKPVLISILEKFEPMADNTIYNFSNTLMYKHLIYDDDLDTLSLGKELIIKIKEILIEFQKSIELYNEQQILIFSQILNFFNIESKNKILESTNLFDFLKFKIIDGYIELYNIYNDDNNIITSELVPNLNHLKSEYMKPIDYNSLLKIILSDNSPDYLINYKEPIEEALEILSQDYVICFQPKVEVLLWTICRLIYCWYADPKLFNNIYKIKILINLFRARGTEEFNLDQGVQPIIMIIPKYGKKNVINVLSHLSYFFFTYKRLGLENSKPTWFDSLDNLMHYTNGSLELKKYIDYLYKTNNIFNNPLTPDMKRINSTDIDNKIEYEINANMDIEY